MEPFYGVLTLLQVHQSPAIPSILRPSKSSHWAAWSDFILIVRSQREAGVEVACLGAILNSGRGL